MSEATVEGSGVSVEPVSRPIRLNEAREAAGLHIAALAAALKVRDQVRGKKIALILSGGNISPAELSQSLAATQ